MIMAQGTASGIIARDVFLTLSFHAKLHSMLDSFAPTLTEGDRQRKETLARDNLLAGFDQSLATIIEKIEKKELGLQDSEKLRELQVLKQDTLLLRNALSEIKNDRIGDTLSPGKE